MGKLKKDSEKFEKYDHIIKKQLAEGIIERVTSQPNGKEYYIPHKPVIRENAESTKMRIVYDASAKSNCSSPSLNECLETGTALQNLLWSVLVKNRFFPVALCGDIKQAFLQVHIKEEDICATLPLDKRQRSKTNRHTTIYKSITWSSSVTISFGWNTRRASRIQERR